ncbi:MAG: three-Cys-motif partner protein TcmP [Pseudomonadota bacterium]
MPKNFKWSLGQQLPNIEVHSIRKLDVLRKYLDVYFDTVVPNPRTDCLNISLVDGFCGGGAYSNGKAFEHGSPIILLRAVEAARYRLNKNREKPLKINARFFFIDKNRDHIECLRQQIVDTGFADYLGGRISLTVGDFADELPKILTQIKSEQRVGRSIFVLDQCGYSDVSMASIGSIFGALDRPEIILTFAIDSLLNYLQENSAALGLYRQFGVDDRFIAEWNNNKSDEALGRLVTQRALMSNIQNNSLAEFFTPFMLWSPTDNRWMMLAHLSRHQAARDKMLGVHWDTQNSFRHIGKGSLFSLGFDARLLESKDALFSFAENDRGKLEEELLSELPAEIHRHISGGYISVRDFLNKIGNHTAATNQDLFGVLQQLSIAREIEVVSPKGTIKRASSLIKLNDGLMLPSQSTFAF